LAVAGLLVLAGGTGTAGQPVDADLAAAVERAPAGAVLRVAPGTHAGPIRIERPLRLVFEPGAVISAPDDAIGIEIVETAGVTIAGASVTGGKHGIVVRHSTRIRLDDVTATGASYHGIFAQNSELVVSGCRVAQLRSPLAQGVEIINSDGRPPSTVRGCRVDGPAFEGIVSHVSRVTFSDNVVTGTSERGISITEMSQGRALRNRVRDAAGTAYWCGDMSNCTLIDNRATTVAVSTPGFKSSGGHGLVVQFHSHAAVEDLHATDSAGRAVLVMSGSVTTDPPSRTPAVWPLLLFGGVLLGLPAASSRLGGLSGWHLLLGTAFGVQLIHQAEHVVQVIQAKVLHRPRAHGVAGAAFDNEWVHLEFNTVLLVALVALVAAGGLRTRPLLLAVAVQGYHQVEHVTKVVQYVRDAAVPAPGILGASTDLVWFHFSINLAVLVLVGGALLTASAGGTGYNPRRRAASAIRSRGWTMAART
jgi:nitrous oxidase accessory protein NosD